MRYSAREILFDQVTCFDHPMIFTDKHVDCRTVPRGYYLYEIRHEKNEPEIPYELSMRVLEDFYGSLISDKPVRLDSNMPPEAKGIYPSTFWLKTRKLDLGDLKFVMRAPKVGLNAYLR